MAQDTSHSKAIRERLHSGHLPISSSSDEQITEITIAQDCLQTDPFLRPTASSLAQQLLELLVAVASEKGPLNHPLELRTNFTGKLATRILADAEKKRSKDAQLVPVKLTRPLFEPLVELAADSSDPSLIFVVGVAYLYDLVTIDEDRIPSRVYQVPASGEPDCIPHCI
jgi:hypothetical protein